MPHASIMSARPMFADAFGRDVVPHDLAIDMLFADAPRDELGVLGTEIHHENGVVQ